MSRRDARAVSRSTEFQNAYMSVRNLDGERLPAVPTLDRLVAGTDSRVDEVCSLAVPSAGRSKRGRHLLAADDHPERAAIGDLDQTGEHHRIPGSAFAGDQPHVFGADGPIRDSLRQGPQKIWVYR